MSTTAEKAQRSPETQTRFRGGGGAVRTPWCEHIKGYYSIYCFLSY